MAVYEGWVFDGDFELDFFPRQTTGRHEYLACLDVERGSITFFNGTDGRSSWYDQPLCGYFEDWRNPTDTERALFEIEFGFCYPSQSLLDQHTGGIEE